MFAATYPERTSALVLYGSYASVKDRMSPEVFERFLAGLEAHWGEGRLFAVNAPSRRNDKAMIQYAGQA
jgi:hypothetical protein